jgi:hypothetical protein
MGMDKKEEPSGEKEEEIKRKGEKRKGKKEGKNEINYLIFYKL